jgi:hypothetical protein
MRDLSMHILDIIQNSVRANASQVELDIIENKETDQYTIIIKDDGDGMDEDTLNRVIDPFFTTRTSRKVGLGLSLLKQNAERTGGHMEISSQLGVGTETIAVFSLSNIDRPVLGDIEGSMIVLIGANPMLRFIYRHKTDTGKYAIDTDEIKEVLDGVAINDIEILNYIKEMIKENLKSIKID